MTRPDETILSRLENKALHYLGRYASTTGRLEQVLTRFAHRKLADEDPDRLAVLIRQKVDDCVRRGYVDDQLYAEQKTASLRNQGSSRMGIRRKLFMAGVGNALIDDAISSHDEDEGDDAETVAAIIYARRRRLGPFARQDNLKDGWKDRHLGSLARAGFSISVARFVLNFDAPASAEDWLNNPMSR